MRSYLITTILTGIFISMFSACYYDKEDKLYPSSNGASCDTSLAKYSKDVSVIVNTNCANASGCHVPGGQLPDLSTYDGLSANAGRVRVRAIEEKTMPASGPLNSCDSYKLQVWIDNGAKND